MADTGIVYLHGFCSSPASWKARLLAEHLAARGLADRLLCPTLSPVPDEAIACLDALLTSDERRLTLVGSSLGGYYASWLAEKYDLRAVLINPAVQAPTLLEGLIGRHANFHTGETFEFTAAHAEQLRALSPATVNPSRYLLLVETGDELLDYHLAVTRFAGCRQTIVHGGDHSFASFAEALPQIVDFCGLPIS
ncbi:MAG TPA: YqiA/YcfP family alpha/beta fold hydrolase [Accumulibacter sp.]|nr:YqiA/YcfP family alpha/beta fold hydrolase [Accumulibacter sp.]HMW18848.1 YqiA/YcfP family alpha/beta fold hydrolase [Accumulibacter sp.]HMX22961.1 YqiA/YcfP family alpha/beta fold hydrolase [Accumulibacter sp.]HNC18878.1 YqiA/YcfP family alpha/beta fold hydrolase [Accumulibacter sp.]HND81410.1 YqiA/YcfP family alpha/beta fold hydrolase [Accumulibacter sp.]